MLLRRRSTIHYLFALFLIGVYGTMVCPFIDSLSPVQIAIPLIIIMSIQYLFRLILVLKWIASAKYENQAYRSFSAEWALFILSGFFLTAVNSFYYDFPVESGLKMILGFSCIGFFAAIDLSLAHERNLINFMQASGTDIQITADQKYFPLVGKFTIFASIAAFFLIGIFFLLINKDLDWLAHVGQQVSIKEAQQSVLLEFVFIGLILLGYILIVINSYAKNLNIFFRHENKVLSDATAGNLNVSVTVSTIDEFGEMAHHTNLMIRRLNQRNQELQLTQDVTIMSLASLAETRDNETGAHILRTQRYVLCLANQLKSHPDFQDFLSDDTINLLYKSAPLHDIGKVGIPDAILLKPGKLDEKEFEIMKQHAALGGDALTRSADELGETSFLNFAREIANSHHEKWDGSGYPLGLKEEEIPVSGRLMAIADVYDALISKRVYKPAFSHEKAMEIILEGRAKHFDPRIVDAMKAVEASFVEIAKKYGDNAD